MSHPESTHGTEDRIDTTQEVTPAEAALSPRMLAMVAVGSALVTSGFVIVALRRRDQMSLTIALPFLGLVMPFFVARLRAAIVIGQGARRWRTSFVRISRPTSLLVLLGLVAPAIILLISFFESILNPRAFQVFIPYLMILTAAGAAVVGGRRSARIPLLLVLATLHVGTVLHWRGYPSESRDYRALSEKMNERMQPGDLLVTVPEEHGVTPIYYYLNERGYTYVTRDYAEALANAPTRRVWLVFFESYGWGPFRTTTEEMMSALTDYRVEVEVEALRARAQLLVRIPD